MHTDRHVFLTTRQCKTAIWEKPLRLERFRERASVMTLYSMTKSAFLLYGKTEKPFRVKGTGQFSSVKMERDDRVPFTPSYVKKTLNSPNFNLIRNLKR